MSGHEAGDRSVVFDLDGTLYDHTVYDQAGARLIGLGRSAYWRAARGLLLDVGPFLAALECATGRQALVFGKPERAIFDAVVDDVGVPAAEVAMVGDDIACDVDAARQAGLRGVLVRTGKFQPADLRGAITPGLVVDSVADLLQRRGS